MTSQHLPSAIRAVDSVAASSTHSGAPHTLIAIRPELPGDRAWIEDLHAKVFGPGRFARTAFRVRERFPIDPSLSLVAEYKGKAVASVWMTPISLTGAEGYLLGPLATDLAYRNKGAGRALVAAATNRALKRSDVQFVLLVGDAPYYQPLGYQPAKRDAILFPGPVDPARILLHCKEGGIAGKLAGTIAAPAAG